MNTTSISLFELNKLIKGVLSENFPGSVWIKAETSDVRTNQNGHCYLEFIEKDASNRSVIAKARAMIWSNTFYTLKAYFENATGQSFTSALKVLVKVSIDFHELYGYSLTVLDIDPSYTIGDQALNRGKIIKQLEEEGVLYLNKELELPQPTNRIAIISSPTAAGYEDFLDQLNNNPYGFKFYTKLFPAIMQGDRAEDSIISALEKIYEFTDYFDAVVIIRGGGATSELSCFDSYLLAASCAQFPLPIITGIGHERDDTVLDIVANTRAKTPTAVAEFLIANMLDLASQLEEAAQYLDARVTQRLHDELLKINSYETQIIYTLKSWRKEQSVLLSTMKDDLSKTALRKINIYTDRYLLLSNTLKRSTKRELDDTKNRLDTFQKHLELMSPETILKKGYTMTMKNGKIVKSIHSLEENDVLTTLFVDGKVKSIIKKEIS